MKLIYKIEVDLYHNNIKNKSKPYFWCLKSYCGKNWCLDSSGWESSPQTAWNTAYEYYLKYKKMHSDIR